MCKYWVLIEKYLYSINLVYSYTFVWNQQNVVRILTKKSCLVRHHFSFGISFSLLQLCRPRMAILILPLWKPIAAQSIRGKQIYGLSPRVSSFLAFARRFLGHTNTIVICRSWYLNSTVFLTKYLSRSLECSKSCSRCVFNGRFIAWVLTKSSKTTKPNMCSLYYEVLDRLCNAVLTTVQGTVNKKSRRVA